MRALSFYNDVEPRLEVLASRPRVEIEVSLSPGLEASD